MKRFRYYLRAAWIYAVTVIAVCEPHAYVQGSEPRRRTVQRPVTTAPRKCPVCHMMPPRHNVRTHKDAGKPI